MFTFIHYHHHQHHYLSQFFFQFNFHYSIKNDCIWWAQTNTTSYKLHQNFIVVVVVCLPLLLLLLSSSWWSTSLSSALHSFTSESVYILIFDETGWVKIFFPFYNLLLSKWIMLLLFDDDEPKVKRMLIYSIERMKMKKTKRKKYEFSSNLADLVFFFGS